MEKHGNIWISAKYVLDMKILHFSGKLFSERTNITIR